MLRRGARLIGTACAALAVGGCAAPVVLQVAGGALIASAGPDLKTALSDVDEKEEIAMGRDFAGRMLGAAPLVRDRGLQAYVNRVGRWVAAQSERPDLPWT